MDALNAVLVALLVIVILFEVARRIGVPYPSVFVVGGAALALIPGVPHITLQPDLVLLVFLPPLLFGAAVETPLRELRANLWPIGRLSFGLVVFTMGVVGAIAHAVVPDMGWPAALTLGAIVAPTDALAATSVFGRVGVPRVVLTLVEGEALFNDATALIAYRTAVAAAVGAVFVLTDAVGEFAVAVAGGLVIGYVVGWSMRALIGWLDDPPVEVVVSLLVPFAAYLPAEQIGVSGVLAVLTAGLVIGRRLGTILSSTSRVLWLTTWKMVAFVLNGLAFVLIGLALPDILKGLGAVPPLTVLWLGAAVCATVIATRFVWIFLAALLPGSPRRITALHDRAQSWRLTAVVGWAGLRGAVSLAAALALPVDFPQRNLILLLTFAVIAVTLVGQGLSLPFVVRWARWDGFEPEGDEMEQAREAMYRAGLVGVAAQRAEWPGHQPLLDRLESGLRDRSHHLATDDPTETAGRLQERAEHEQIQRSVIGAQRAAVIRLRDSGRINDATLRVLERELDLEELRMEA